MRSLSILLLVLLALPACGSESETPPAKPGATDGGPSPAPTPAPTPEAGPALANEHGVDAATAARLNEALKKGRAFLLSQQADNGGWGLPSLKMPPDVGYTAMGALGLIAATDKIGTKTDENILKALRFVAAAQEENGAIFDNPQYVSYHTSVSIGALAAARVPEFAKALTRAVNFLADFQIRGDESDLSYGGFPYKQDSKGLPADLSNAQFAAQALKDGGLPDDHEAWKALPRFLRRVQSNSEGNDEVVEVEVDGEKRQVVSATTAAPTTGPAPLGSARAAWSSAPTASGSSPATAPCPTRCSSVSSSPAWTPMTGACRWS